METPESTIELCPDMILDNVGGAFVMGIAGGSAFHFIRGIYNYPAGARLSGGAECVRMNVPRVGGSFAVWSGVFSSFDCAMAYARQKEDSWNSIFAGAATGGLMSLRRGLLASRNGALFSGALATLTVGAWTAVYNFENADQQNEEAFMGDAASSLPPGVHEETSSASVAGSRSWFGGLLGSATQILESFDASHVPTDEFN